MLDLFARHHDLSAAALAAELKVHADSQDEKSVIAAGMRLFHNKLIADSYIHKLPLTQSYNHRYYTII